jgi:hypothetical protein
MFPYLISLIIGAVLWQLFKRQILIVLGWIVLLIVLYGLLRAAPIIGMSGSWIASAYGGTLIGIVAGVLLAWRVIINFHVERDYDREVQRARGNADKRRV